MNSLISSLGPAILALLAAFGVLGVAILFRAAPVYLLVLHVISRIVLDSAPEYTYAKLAGGLSLMQLYSVGFTAFSCAYLFSRDRLAWHSFTGPLIALVAAYAVSAVISNSWLEFATATLRWFYLWSLIALTVYAMSEGSERSIMLGISVAGLYAFGNQMYSVVADTPKWGAGMWTYVGSFKHESDLCFIFLMLSPAALYFLTCSRQIKDKILGLTCLGAVCIGLYYGAYRSLWVAFAAYMLLYLWNRYLRGNMTSRAIWLSISMGGVVAISVTVGPAIFGKVSDLAAFITQPQLYLDFSGSAKRTYLMSGRVDLVNSYMSLYLNSGIDVIFGGIGPGQGTVKVGLYAHNEYLSALVETGLIGFVALLWLMVRYISRASSINKSNFAGAQVAAPFFMVMCVSSLGTMPFRDMRGMLAMGLMMGVAEWYSSERRQQRARKPTPARTVEKNENENENGFTFLS